jgi:dihydrolipoamide dehydrogenase
VRDQTKHAKFHEADDAEIEQRNGVCTMATQITVIGSGPAGTAAAQAAAAAKARVCLVSDHPLGGRAHHDTLLLSQTWLSAANAFSQGQGSAADVIRQTFAEFQQTAAAWREQLRLTLMDQHVELLTGEAYFTDEGNLLLQSAGQSRTLESDAVIIATGAVPLYPPELQPDGQRVLGPHQSTAIGMPPAHVIVVGGGPPAAEYVDALTRLGYEVTWLVGQYGILAPFARDAVDVFVNAMRQRNLHLIQGETAQSIDTQRAGIRLQTVSGRSFGADYALMCLGYRPDLDRLKLESFNLHKNPAGRIQLNPYGQTSNPNVYIIGDAAQPLSANVAIACGRTAGWHAAGKTVEPFSLSSAVLAIYSDPAIAQVGLTNRAQAASVKVQMANVLKSHLLNASGLVEIFYNAEGSLVGGYAVGPQAAEIVNLIALAIQLHASVDQLRPLALAHPTVGEILTKALEQIP